MPASDAGASPTSSGSKFWSASDHGNNLSGTLHSWPSTEAESVPKITEADLLTLETLSISDEESGASVATPTFSDLNGASEAVNDLSESSVEFCQQATWSIPKAMIMLSCKCRQR